MEIIEPKRIIGVNMYEQPCELFTVRTVHTEGMQEFLCPDGKERYEAQGKREFERKNNINKSFENRLAPDSEEQLRYNTFIENISDYDNYEEYKYKTSFKYKVLKFLKLVK